MTDDADWDWDWDDADWDWITIAEAGGVCLTVRRWVAKDPGCAWEIEDAKAKFLASEPSIAKMGAAIIRLP